jgi:anti-sigma regulatory factor (Ser/Thr protein kinase)
LELELPPDPGAPAAARRALRTVPLGAHAGDVLLLVSELVTNAVVHAGTGGPIELTVEYDADRTWVEVRDHGPGFGPAPPRGYGMQMLAAASAHWGIVHDGTTRIWFDVPA